MRNVYRAATAALLLIMAGGVVGAQTMNAREAQGLLETAENLMFPESFVATFRMTTERPRTQTTEMVMENTHKENVGSFIEVMEPRRSAGMRFLQKDEDLWMYNPRARSRRAIRLSPRDSFQGSVFSNNDVGDPDYGDDYQARFVEFRDVEHGQLGTVESWVIEASATHSRAAYGMIRMYGRRADDMPLRIEYFAKSGLLFKRLELSDFGPLAGATRPQTMTMHSLEERGAVTVVSIESMEEREDLPDRIFNQAELTR